MQTFMPYSNYNECAQALDNKRLGKQRVETWQIYNVLKKLIVPQQYKVCCTCFRVVANSLNCERHPETKYTRFVKTEKFRIGWLNHPIVKMWRGYETSLLCYGLAMCLEWKRRGFKDSLYEKFYNELVFLCHSNSMLQPPWTFDEELQESHRSNLIRKDAEFYRPKFERTRENLAYKWVINTIKE